MGTKNTEDSPRQVLITGATRGLGLAMARRFRALGHRVNGCGRSSEMISRLNEEFGTSGTFARVDVADDRQVAAWAERFLAQGPPPDLLLNNAAVIHRNAPLWKVSAQEFDLMVDINIKGVVNVIRHFLPAMLAVQRGIIVNFSSGWGRSTSPEVAGYCASKYAIEGLTQALAQELPEGMAAIPLNPGIIDTEMLRSCFGAQAGNYSDPEQWSRTAVPFLLSLTSAQNGESLTAPG